MMIRNLQVLAIAILISSVAMGYRSVRVCLSDGNTPLELADPCVPWVYRDIMVGTHLTIITDSNVGGMWVKSGELSIEGTDRDYGVLSGRDYNATTHDWKGSRFPAADDGARVWDFQEDPVSGFSFSGDPNAIAGDWFIIDYNATAMGNCQVNFYDYDLSDEPLYEMSFTHVPSRDFNEDNIVNFADFAVLGSYWGITDCTDPDGCGRVDFYNDDTIDINDLGLFVEFWLERTN